MTVAFRIPWSGRGVDYSEEEIQAVVDTMRQGDPLTQGPRQAEFEGKFASYLGVDRAFAVSNCTNAIDLVALLARIQPGDEIIAPAHTFCASVIPFLRRGAVIRWADIDPETRLVSAATIEPLISARTKLIMVVHLYGLMPDMAPIMALGQERGIPVMEDAAQAIGASDSGRKAGSWGDYAVFSFHAQKSITTLGEGGALVVRDPDQQAMVPGLRHNGIRPFSRTDDKYWLPAMSNVDLDLEGELPFNFCLGEAQSALATKVLERIDAMNAERNARAHRFRDALEDHPGLSFQEVGPEKEHAYHLLAARFDATQRGATRDDFIARMAFQHGIQVIVQYYPLYRYPLFRRMGMGKADCPETDRYFDNMVSFPFHHWIPDNEFQYMIEKTIETTDHLRERW